MMAYRSVLLDLVCMLQRLRCSRVNHPIAVPAGNTSGRAKWNGGVGTVGLTTRLRNTQAQAPRQLCRRSVEGIAATGFCHQT